MNIKINKQHKMFAVAFPPRRRTVFFDHKAYNLRFPEHLFIFPIILTSEKHLVVRGFYPIKFVLKEQDKFYVAPISAASRTREGDVCIDYDHRSFQGELEKTINLVIEKFWTVRWPTGEESSFLTHWIRNTGELICEHFPMVEGNLPEFTESSIEDLKEFIASL